MSHHKFWVYEERNSNEGAVVTPTEMMDSYDLSRGYMHWLSVKARINGEGNSVKYNTLGTDGIESFKECYERHWDFRSPRTFNEPIPVNPRYHEPTSKLTYWVYTHDSRDKYHQVVTPYESFDTLEDAYDLYKWLNNNTKGIEGLKHNVISGNKSKYFITSYKDVMIHHGSVELAPTLPLPDDFYYV